MGSAAQTSATDAGALRGDRLAVWGDPIGHSRSPQLHAAAYRHLGLPWQYSRRQIARIDFDAALRGLDDSWRGLSCTFPLKERAFDAAIARDRAAERTGAVNTLLLGADGPHGFNTDVGGLAGDLRRKGLDRLDDARIVGAGATATSALLAVAELGARYVEVVARRPRAVEPLERLGDAIGVTVMPVPTTAPAHSPLQLTIATLPGGARLLDETAAALAASGGTLYDVVYGEWPTALADLWQQAGHSAHHGLGMLLEQALLQVRLFVGANAAAPLPDETGVREAMRSALAAADEEAPAAVGD